MTNPAHHIYQDLTANQQTEAQRLIQDWEQATFDNVEDSVEYHYRRHRGEATLLQYLHAAASYNTRGARRTYLPDGNIRYNKPDGEFLIKNPNTSKIVSYGKNRS